MTSSLQFFQLYFEYISRVAMSVTCLIQPSLLYVINKMTFIEAALSGYSLCIVHTLY